MSDLHDFQPEEGDLFTFDYEYFFEVGDAGVFDVKLKKRAKVHVPEGKDWRDCVKKYMDDMQFWPGVWFVSDHGNVTNLSMEV
jgi:hypothetical protein